ncbi:nucleophosmin 1a [Nematolebias whitei]|uniref:nucleophosmin 1a n=1 Tax=Nematolebias whitei TaxID=451745 RepID=UPI0018999489|nr:nucleophosmin 1a [Nematolebias whitei]
MNGLNEESMSPQTFLYGCVLEAGKEVVFNPDDDGFEHQLDLRMACVDPGTKAQLHTVEVEGQDSEGQKVKAVLAALMPSTLPSVCLGGFTITPPAVFRLKAGPGPVHISGQHLVMMEPDQSFDEEDDNEEDEEEEIQTSKKRPASSPAPKPQKKMKVEMDEDDEEDEEDEEDEDDEEDEEESEVEESPVKAKATPAKTTPAKQKNSQNGKSSAPSTPAPKQVKTPKAKDEKSPKTPSPEANLTLPEIKAKIMMAVKKGVSLPKVQSKFENFLKHSQKISDPKFFAELWKWRESMAEDK